MYADNTMVYPLLYMQEVKGQGADVKIISGIASSEAVPTIGEKSIGQWLAEGNVYTASHLRGYELKQEGIIWEITGQK